MTNTDKPVPVRVIRAAGTVDIAAVVQRAAVAATVGHCHVIAGIVSIPHFPPRFHRAWRVSLSHWGRPPVAVSMHRLRRDAEAQMGRAYRANSERDLRDDVVFAALIQDLAAFGDGDVA